MFNTLAGMALYTCTCLVFMVGSNVRSAPLCPIFDHLAVHELLHHTWLYICAQLADSSLQADSY